MKSLHLTVADVLSRIEDAHAAGASGLRGRLTLSVNGMHRLELRGLWSVDPQREIFGDLVRFRLPWTDFWFDVKTLRFTDTGSRLDAVSPGPLPFLFWNPKLEGIG